MVSQLETHEAEPEVILLAYQELKEVIPLERPKRMLRLEEIGPSPEMRRRENKDGEMPKNGYSYMY